MNTPQPIPFTPEDPQPLVRNIASGATYPVEHLGPLQAAVEAVQARTQAPVAIPAASALAVASLAVQGFADVETLGGTRPLSLYALTIARSGERKSSCDAPLMAALRDHEREQADAQAEAVTRWQNAHALWKGDRTASEPTFEGLTRLYATGQPSLGIFSDEGGQFLGGHAMNSDNRQKTLAALNDLWQGNPIRRTRASDGHAALYGRRLAVHLMVQPGVARAFMADPMAVDTGFLPRFLICEPPSTIGTRLHRAALLDGGPLETFGHRLSKILSAPLPVDDTRALTPRRLDLSPEAEALLIDYANEVEAAQIPGGTFSGITGHASKSAEQAARIAGVLTLWRGLDAPAVGANDMAHGIALARYYLAEALRLSDAAPVSQDIDRAEGLRKWLLEKWEHPEVLTRDVVRRGPNALRESPKARAALTLLERHGWLIRLDAGVVVRGAARAEAWKVRRES